MLADILALVYIPCYYQVALDIISYVSVFYIVAKVELNIWF